MLRNNAFSNDKGHYKFPGIKIKAFRKVSKNDNKSACKALKGNIQL